MLLNKQDISLFSLFHHELENPILEKLQLKKLFNFSKETESKKLNDLIEILINLIEDKISGLKDHEIGLTLTGGFDSRIILSVLLYLKRKPICFTYGDERNRDIIIAKQICKQFNLKFVHTVNQKIDADWYDKWVDETIIRGKGNAHLHRAHRTASIQEFVAENPIKLLFTGHFGGESIRGLSYNNYFSSSYFEDFNENRHIVTIKSVLKNYFVKTSTDSELDTIQNEISKLSWMAESKNERTFYFLYDLVANIHHQQDIEIFKTYVPNVVPVFMTNEFQNVLVKSPFHYSRRSKGKLAKLKHPELYYLLLKHFEPKLMEIPLTNGYKPSMYQKGILYYGFIRFYNKIFKKIKNHPSFKYDDWYVDYVKMKSHEISDEIWQIFDKENYFKALDESQHESNEGYWHKFSNPIFFDLLLKSKLISR
ncbi:MAG: hypothetical protein ACKO7D_02845 [Bacteroidota bacterium]